MFSCNQRSMRFWIFLMAFAIFSISISSQIFFGKEPCQLCLFTRYMFLLTAIVALSRIKILLPIVAFATVGCAFYHLGVESHWWSGPSGCVSELPTLSSVNDLDQIPAGKVYCDRANWIILGVSSTLWSFLFSMFLFWISSLSFVVNYYIEKLEDDD